MSNKILHIGILSFVLAISMLSAQTTTGTLSGRITNNIGAPIANAAVTITNIDTNAS